MLDVTLQTPKRAIGFLAESRFFHLVNAPIDPRERRPRGFVRAEQAAPIVDVRGIDGFVYHSRSRHATEPMRIPIQLKVGYGSGDMFAHTRCGIRVPIIRINTQVSQFNVLERIRKLLDSHDRFPREYDERKLHDIEHNRTTVRESEVVKLIEMSRAMFGFQPIVPRTADTQSL